MPKIGCNKCEYTGFAYGKIPCECSIRAESPKIANTDDYIVDGPPLVIDYSSYNNDGMIIYYGSQNRFRCKLDSNKPIKVGEAIKIDGQIIGRALSDTDSDGNVDVLFF